jgi:hypothetical protein
LKTPITATAAEAHRAQREQQRHTVRVSALAGGAAGEEEEEEVLVSVTRGPRPVVDADGQIDTSVRYCHINTHLIIQHLKKN